MKKISDSKKIKRKGCALILASLLLSSLPLNSASTVQAKDDNEYHRSIDEGLDSCGFSNITKGILKAISETTDKENVLHSIDIAIDADELSEYFIAQGICSFAQEQAKKKFKEAYEIDQYNPYLYIDYSVDDICVIDNLNGASSYLPKQICLLTKISDFGNYRLYEVHDTEPSYVITNRFGDVLTFSTGYTYDAPKSQRRKVTPFKEFLGYVGLPCEDKYSSLELFDELTFDISEKLSNNYSENSKTSDVLVVDCTGPLTNCFNNSQDYYFIKYVYPYLFVDGRKVFKDVANPDAKITVDDKNTLRYYDRTTDARLFDLDFSFIDSGISSSCLVKLKDFLKNQGAKVGNSVTDEFLKDLNNIYNNDGKTLTNTCK